MKPSDILDSDASAAPEWRPPTTRQRTPEVVWQGPTLLGLSEDSAGPDDVGAILDVRVNNSQTIRIGDPEAGDEDRRSTIIFFPRHNAYELDFGGGVAWVKVIDRPSRGRYLVVERKCDMPPRAYLSLFWGVRTPTETAMLDEGIFWDLSSGPVIGGKTGALALVPISRAKTGAPPVFSLLCSTLFGDTYGARRTAYAFDDKRYRMYERYSIVRDDAGRKLAAFPGNPGSMWFDVLAGEDKVAPLDHRHLHDRYFLAGGPDLGTTQAYRVQHRANLFAGRGQTVLIREGELLVYT